MLRQHLGRVAWRVLPDWLVRLAARFDTSLRLATRELGQIHEASNEKARRLPGYSKV